MSNCIGFDISKSTIDIYIPKGSLNLEIENSRIITNNKSAIITRGFKSNKYIGFNTEAVSFLKQGY